MEKHKRKSKQGSYPIEFVAPYSLAECLSRLPEGSSIQISPHLYEFWLRSNINDRRNQFINVHGFLREDTATTTVVFGGATISLLFYLLMVLVVPILLIVFVGMTEGLTAGIVFLACVFGLYLYALHHDKTRFANSVFEVFQPVPKAKRSIAGKLKPLLFPTLPLSLTVNAPLETSATRLRQLAFWPMVSHVRSVNENEYRVNLFGMTGSWMGVQTTGSLKQITPYLTQVKGHVGCGCSAYLPLLFTLLMLFILVNANERWFSIVPIAVVLFPIVHLIHGLINIFALRRVVKQALLQ